MSKILGILWLILALAACGIDYTPSWAVFYIDMFNYEANIRGCSANARDITYMMVNEFSVPKEEQVENAVGYCYSNGIIEVSRSWWTYFANDTEKEIMMFHELGHCVLNLGHSKTGIMQPVLMSNTVYEYNRKVLLDQLFMGCL